MEQPLTDAVSPYSSPPLRYSNTPFHSMQRDVVTVERFYTEHASSLELKLVAGAKGLKRIIREPTVNRPGLALAGFTKYFASKRIQVIGSAESTFLKSLSSGERKQRYTDLFSYKIPCVVFSRSIHPDKIFLRAAEHADVGNLIRKQVRVTRSEEHTSELQSRSDLVCRLLLEKKKQ